MMPPAAAIWTHAACCCHSMSPNPDVPACALIPTCQQRRTGRTCSSPRVPASVFVLSLLPHRGTCWMSTFTGGIFDESNETLERCRVPNYSCSVLSILCSASTLLFFASVYTFPLTAKEQQKKKIQESSCSSSGVL